MAANGYIPSSWLKQLPGSNAGLIKGYAYAYWAWHYKSIASGGPALTIIDGQVGRTYRTYARQVMAKRIYGSNAATPGTSNHGLARAVDLMTQAQRSASDRWGAPFGWLKAWSDASWEWWHLKGVKTMANPRPPGPSEAQILKPLGPRQKLAAKRLLYHRREAAREARSGKGPRYRKHVKYRDRWRKTCVTYWRRARGKQKQVLERVLKDKNGRL